MGHLRGSHVLVIGLSEIGTYVAETVYRAGVGQMTIADADIVRPISINRQLPAAHVTLGMEKTKVLEIRFRDISPETELNVLPVYLKDENTPELLDVLRYDSMVGAVDTTSPKCYLVYHALQRHAKIVSSMDVGARSDITQVRLVDLWNTYYYGLSKAVCKHLRKMGMKRELPVVFSIEQADPKAVLLTKDERNRKSTCGTISYTPTTFGCCLAEYVIRRL